MSNETMNIEDPALWLQECPLGELRSLTVGDTTWTVDRRPIVVVQKAGASAEQHLTVTTDGQPVARVHQSDEGSWVNLTLSELLERAPSPSNSLAYRDYMEMVKQLIAKAVAE